jgi:hypothetical protein
MGGEQVRDSFQEPRLIKMQSPDIILIIEAHYDKAVRTRVTRRYTTQPD